MFPVHPSAPRDVRAPRGAHLWSLRVIEIPISALAYLGASFIAVLVAYGLGKRAKLRELHRLQEQGLLDVRYLGRGPQRSEDRVRDLLHNQEEDEDELGLDVVAYPRKDRDEDRKVDWAKEIAQPGD